MCYNRVIDMFFIERNNFEIVMCIILIVSEMLKFFVVLYRYCVIWIFM